MPLRAVALPPAGPGFPFALDLLRGARRLEVDPAVTVLVGENGSGKSSLLEAIAIAAELPTAGAVDLEDDPTLDAVRPLADALRLEWTARSRRGLFLRAEDYFGYAQRVRRHRAELLADAARADAALPPLSDAERARRLAPYLGSAAALEGRYGGDLDARSHGESFLAFFQARLTGPGLYVLDEPEAALSPLRQLALLALVRDATARGAQFLIATHAPMLMAYPGARRYQLSEHGAVETPFEELEHVRTLRAFLDDPEAYLRRL
ncbi:MAG: AAA family ATPase [Trueperaceae bacterium]|nr:AAA family ATPase [Trueperaceae bacterium]